MTISQFNKEVSGLRTTAAAAGLRVAHVVTWEGSIANSIRLEEHSDRHNSFYCLIMEIKKTQQTQ